MRWRLWPRKFIQPDSAPSSRRGDLSGDCVGDTLALGLFLLVGVLGLAATATGWRDAPRTIRASPAELALGGKPTVRPLVGVERAKARRARLAMARPPSR